MFTLDALLEIDPADLSPAQARSAVAEVFAGTVVGGIPIEKALAVDLDAITSSVRTMISAAAAGGVAGALGAAGAAIVAVSAGGKIWAESLRKAWRDEWNLSQRNLAKSLINGAQGNLVAPLQPWGDITGAPPLKSQVQGSEAVAPLGCGVFPRPLNTRVVVSLLPWTTVQSLRLPYTPEAGFYGNGKRPKVSTWPEEWTGQSLVSPALTGGTIETLALAAEIRPRPPVAALWEIAPGLAPNIGPHGETVPCDVQLLAYAASMFAHFPPDLDEVATRVAGAPDHLGKRRIVDQLRALLWAREKAAQQGIQGAGAPRGAAYLGPLAMGKQTGGARPLPGKPGTHKEPTGPRGPAGAGGLGARGGSGDVEVGGSGAEALGAVALLGGLGYFLLR